MFYISWVKCAFLIMQFPNKSKYLTLFQANRFIIFHDTRNYPFAFTNSNVIVTCTTIINLFIMLCLLLFMSVKHSLNHSGKTHFLFKSQRREQAERMIRSLCTQVLVYFLSTFWRRNRLPGLLDMRFHLCDVILREPIRMNHLLYKPKFFDCWNLKSLGLEWRKDGLWNGKR